MFRSKHPATNHGQQPSIQKRYANSRRAPSPYWACDTTYDAESGQMYTERLVRASTTAKVNWMHEYKTPSLVKRRQSHRAGAASLFDMAKAKVAREMRNLTAGHFKAVPSSIARPLWDEIEESRLESFHAWRTFVAAFSDSFRSPLRRYFLDIKTAVLPPNEYFTGLNSESLAWLTCLRVNPTSLDRSDLVRLGQLRNLVVLDLSDDILIDSMGKQIDERIFKTWTEMAVEGQAFKHVRAILMRGQADVSTWIFQYLDSFPSLCFIVFSDCRLIHQKNRAIWAEEAASRGWEARHGKKSAKSVRQLIEDKNFYLGAVSGCYYHSEDAFDRLATENKSNVAGRLPVVEAWIGKPKPWLHLIDEFPGTRTVWFDNIKTKEAAQRAEAGRKTEAPVLARAARSPLAEGVRITTAEETTKRPRDMLSIPATDMALTSPPLKRTTMKLRSRTKNLSQLMADFG